MAIPSVLKNKQFGPFWVGTVLAEVGSRATVAASLFLMYELTNSTAMVGLVGLSQAVALILLSPLGGVLADHLDRRRLLQVTQGVALVVSLALGVVTILGLVLPWHVLLASLLAMAMSMFDRPVRLALTAAIVPRQDLGKALALLNPSREIAILVGPALAGILIAVGGTGVVFIFAAVTYGILILLLIGIKVTVREKGDRAPFFKSLAEGVRYVRQRPIIWSLMGLDLSQTLFGAYRVLLPAFALDVLNAGPAGYGLLAAAPSLGALLGTPIIYRLAQRRGSGKIVLLSTMAFGVTCVLFALSPFFALSLVIALGLGFFDALAATIRMSAVQLETPDELRGRVTSLYQLTGRGGPALGDANIGLVASIVGPVIALTAGGLVPIIAAAAVWRWGSTVRDYESKIDDDGEDQKPQ